MLVTWYHKNNENDSLTSFLHNNFKYHTLTEQDKQHLTIFLRGDIMLKRDGHVHSPFCPHGSKDEFRYYIEELCKKGFQSVSFTVF